MTYLISKMTATALVLLTIKLVLVYADYDCLCNYNVEKAVYPTADVTGQPVGYLYEFDCKPLATAQGASNNWYSVQFAKQLAYVAKGQQVQVQTCPGQPPTADLLPTTTVTTPTTPSSSTQEQTTKVSSASTHAMTSATSTTLSTKTTTETTTVSTPSTTIKSTTPLPTTRQTTRTTTVPETTTSTTTTTTTSKQTTTKMTTHPTTRQTTQTTTVPETTTSTTTTTSRQTTTKMTTHPSTTTTKLTTTRQPTTTPTTVSTTTHRPTTSSTTTKITTPLTTRTTTPFMYWSMAANVTGTPYQYVGIGYNLLKGNPDTTSDPGYLPSQRIFQLTGNSAGVREAAYENHTACNSQTSKYLLYGTKAYQDELKDSVKPSASHNGNLMASAFTFSSHFQTMRNVLDRGSTVYIDRIATCNYGNVRYLTENAKLGNFGVTREFAKDVCAMPETITSTNIVQYMGFLDKWGTSIVTKIELGTKSVDRYQTTPAQLFQHVEKTDPNLLRHSGTYKGFSNSVTINTHDYPYSNAGKTTIGTHRRTSIGSAAHQIPIGAELVPITDALNWNYWKPVINELVAEGVCPERVLTSHLSPYLQGVTMALNQYRAFKDSQAGTQHSQTLVDRPAVQVPITWPSGTYGLMKSKGGCPAGNTRWSEGWRKFDTEDTLSSDNSYTPGIQNYLSGEFHSNDIVNRFCMKTSTHSISGGQYDQQWPRGSYCLLKKGSCPSGFGSGYIFWDDEDFTNHNDKGGTLPDGTYDKNTKIYYCCRNDGFPNANIFLPTDRPFAMMRYGRTCQAVHDMHVRDLYVYWDDEDAFNKDKTGGVHPLDEGGSNNHKIHFCYYQSTAGPSIIG